jgi:DNA repair exonuclease SbcCD ATPase subunit
MDEELESATPAQVEQAEQVQQVESNSAEATTEQSQEAEQQTEQKEKKTPWFEKRISEVTREKYEHKRAAEQAMQEAQQLREQLARVQSGEQYEAPEADVMTLAEQRAQQLLAERSFNEACNKVYHTGKTEFPDFDQAVSNLQMVGVGREFLELATTSDAGAKLIHHLGTDLDEAARIAALPPVQMARELTRLEFKLAQPVAKPVSKAPAPITPIGAGGASDSGLRDDLPIDEWMRRNRAKKT